MSGNVVLAKDEDYITVLKQSLDHLQTFGMFELDGTVVVRYGSCDFSTVVLFSFDVN